MAELRYFLKTSKANLSSAMRYEAGIDIRTLPIKEVSPDIFSVDVSSFPKMFIRKIDNRELWFVSREDAQKHKDPKAQAAVVSSAIGGKDFPAPPTELHWDDPHIISNNITQLSNAFIGLETALNKNGWYVEQNGLNPLTNQLKTWGQKFPHVYKLPVISEAGAGFDTSNDRSNLEKEMADVIPSAELDKTNQDIDYDEYKPGVAVGVAAATFIFNTILSTPPQVREQVKNLIKQTMNFQVTEDMILRSNDGKIENLYGKVLIARIPSKNRAFYIGPGSKSNFNDVDAFRTFLQNIQKDHQNISITITEDSTGRESYLQWILEEKDSSQPERAHSSNSNAELEHGSAQEMVQKLSNYDSIQANLPSAGGIVVRCANANNKSEERIQIDDIKTLDEFHMLMGTYGGTEWVLVNQSNVYQQWVKEDELLESTASVFKGITKVANQLEQIGMFSQASMIDELIKEAGTLSGINAWMGQNLNPNTRQTFAPGEAAKIKTTLKQWCNYLLFNVLDDGLYKIQNEYNTKSDPRFGEFLNQMNNAVKKFYVLFGEGLKKPSSLQKILDHAIDVERGKGGFRGSMSRLVNKGNGYVAK